MEGNIYFEKSSYQIIGIAIEVHKKLGTGYEEKFYQRALAKELSAKNIRFCREEWIPIYYKGQKLGVKRIDFIIEDIFVEIKAKAQFEPQDFVQTLSYLKATKHKTGLLLNFGASQLQIKRFVN